MTVTTRDAWSDAHVAATQEFLEGDLVAVRRRIWLRRAVWLVLSGVIFLAAFYLVQFVVDPDVDELWSPSLHVIWAGFGLAGVGLALMIVGSVRAFSRGVDRPFVGPDAFLSRADRAWLRSQIAEGRPVPDERRAVVTDAARQRVAETTFLPNDLGLALLYVGMMVATPFPSLLLTFSVLTVWMLVRIARTQVWSRRARRWLAQNT